MANPLQIYNSRILKLYTECIHKRHPEVDIDGVLRRAGVSRYELEDQGHWFSQKEIDAFFNAVVKETGNPRIAREAGRYVVENETSGPVKQVALGLLQIASIYLLLPKLYTNFSRGARVKTRKLASNKVEICVTTLPHVHESPHQCENRIGIFESLSLPFTGKYATIDHPECLHKGGHCCRYVASWEASRHIKWKRLFSTSLVVGCAVSAGAMIFWPLSIWLPVLLVCALVSQGIYLSAKQLQNQELTQLIQNQGSVAEDHIKEIEYRYQGALLVQKIGRASSAVLDKKRLSEIVIQNIKQYLDFDRGLIMLASANRTRLVYAAGYGFDRNTAELIAKARFRLDNPNSKGVFVKVFHSQRPVLVEDINALSGAFSVRSRQMIRRIGSKSMICLPIVHKDESLGILAVDNIHTKRPLTKSDMNLLMAVAYQTAVSIFSANAFKRLQKSEGRYRGLYENAPTAYVSIGIEDAVIVKCNAAAERLLGYRREHLIGSSLLSYVGDGQASRMRAQRMHKLLLRGQSTHNEALELRHRTSGSVWVLVSLEPHKDAGGRLIEGRCILVDTTEQKHLEEQLRKAQQMEVIGTLAGGVAHDLSNILAAIVGYPDLLLMDVGPDNPMYKPLVKLRSAGSRAAAIVQDLLTLSRRGVAISDVIDLNSAFQEYIDSPEYDDLLKHHPNFEMIVDLSADLHLIKGSSVHLTKTIMNVIHNAAEALPPEGVIRVTTYNRYVGLGEYSDKYEPGRYVVFCVEDNGHGIAPEDLKRVFEPFFTKKVMGRSGTGLGMAIVWGAVQDHNGFIDIQSQLGKGTTVSLYFPATTEKAVSRQPDIKMVEFMGHGEEVMVADDKSEHRDIAVHMMTRLGYEVTAVGSGKDVIDRLAKGYRPDAILLDAALEQDTVLSLVRQIKRIRPEQEAIIITGLSKPAHIKQVLDAGASTYVKKPYSLKALGATIRYELERRSFVEPRRKNDAQ